MQVLYKAKIPCRVGGAYRRAGEVFPLPEFEATPPFLERVEAEGRASEPAHPPKARSRRGGE